MAARNGDVTDARQLAKQAFAGYDTLAADAWHRQLRADLHAAGLPMRPRRGAGRAVSGWPSLTASEQAIVQLVGSGLTNTEIAGRLFVSRRTVESHLGRVYPKLGLSTRSQLVSAVARRVDTP
jgi:DNA-binding CsgD family transcriptional regulator